VVTQSHQLFPENDQVRAGILGMGMILLGRPDDDINHIGKTTATLTPFLEGAVHLDRDDQLPAILVEKTPNRLFDLTFGNDVAVTGNHSFSIVFRWIRHWSAGPHQRNEK